MKNNNKYLVIGGSFTPDQAIKLVPKSYIDLGFGILEVINKVKNS